MTDTAPLYVYSSHNDERIKRYRILHARNWTFRNRTKLQPMGVPILQQITRKHNHKRVLYEDDSNHLETRIQIRKRALLKNASDKGGKLAVFNECVDIILAKSDLILFLTPHTAR